MAYVNKRSGKNGAERFTGLYKAADGTHKSAGTFDTEERALEVAEAAERHARLQLAETSPADKATVTLATYMEMFLSAANIEANSKETYARHLTLHVIPYISKQRVAEVPRETIHRLLTVVLKQEGASQTTILHTRTALSAMLQMAWDNGYRKDNPVRGIKLKGVPTKPIIVATKDQFLRVYNALPHQPAKVLARLGVSSGARLCELISLIPEDFDFAADMLAVRRSTVEVTAKYHPTGNRFLTREYTKNGEHRRFKIDRAVPEMVREHIALHGIGPGQVIFPVRLFASTVAAGRDRLTREEIDALGFTDELPNGRRYKHGTLGGYVTAKCRCRRCKQWSADYARDRKRRRTGRSAREWSPAWRNDPTEYLGADVWRRIWNAAVDDAGLPFPYTVTHDVASRKARLS
jgi:integrase